MLTVIKTLVAIYFLLFTSYLKAQDSIRIYGQLKNNTKFTKVVVQKFGTGVFDIAAVAVDKETGNFNITAPIYVEQGIYRFRYSQTGYGDYVDVIINGKDTKIDFSVDINQEPDNRNPFFTASEENKIWYQFKKQQKEKLNELMVKQNFLVSYPNKKDKSYVTLQKEYEKSVKEYIKNHHQFIGKTPFYWAKSLSQFQNVYFPDLNEHPRIQIYNAHENFWEGKPTKDTLLLNTPLYTDAILNYLQYYMNPDMQFSEEEQNNGFKKCVDKIVAQFGTNESTKEFAIKYLQMGFKEIGNETILQYIDQTYAVNEQCTTEDDELKKRLKGYETLQIEKQAPDIELTVADGSTKTLKDFSQEQVLVVFWASWCPHCMEEMPKLQEWAKTQNNTLILAVSLDDDFSKHQETIKQFPEMLHYCDLQKWNGKIVSDYYVAATPTLFLLDKERKIVNKFNSIESFINSSTNK